MIWRSVVGKLWMTIIILVSLVLVLLNLFLNEQVEKTYVRDQKKSLEQLAGEIQKKFNQPGYDHIQYLNNVLQVSELFHTYIVTLDASGSVSNYGVSPHVPNVPWQEVLSQDDLNRVLKGETLFIQGKVRVKSDPGNFPFFKNDVLLVAVPHIVNDKTVGAIVLYQTQEQLSENGHQTVDFLLFADRHCVDDHFCLFLVNPDFPSVGADEKSGGKNGARRVFHPGSGPLS